MIKWVNTCKILKQSFTHRMQILLLFKPGVLKFSLVYVDVGSFFIHCFEHSVVPFSLEINIP